MWWLVAATCAPPPQLCVMLGHCMPGTFVAPKMVLLGRSSRSGGTAPAPSWREYKATHASATNVLCETPGKSQRWLWSCRRYSVRAFGFHVESTSSRCICPLRCTCNNVWARAFSVSGALGCVLPMVGDAHFLYLVRCTAFCQCFVSSVCRTKRLLGYTCRLLGPPKKCCACALSNGIRIQGHIYYEDVSRSYIRLSEWQPCNAHVMKVRLPPALLL